MEPLAYEIYSVARPLIESTTWLPRPKRSIELLNLLGRVINCTRGGTIRC